MGNKFEFKLQKLLDIRMKEEDFSKMEFKRALEDRNMIANKIDELESTYSKYNIFSTEDNLMDRKLKVSYLKFLTSSIDKANIELNKKTEILNIKRVDLNKKQIRRKTVETLKCNDYSEFLKEEKLFQQKLNDELALYGFMRKNKELVK
ncbi:flagellar export protein FliJ [Hathewaya histolytica]|uniref:Flagellar FliJ protein n=1 Tax=Hathewaya histolytica TaxID=1498 RepID=A0A4U9R8N6_HATHI|nr:flagellar export protein FliJ [Hathewaya histolytica]VTQ87699.1 flagellar biosynthesis chaperone FliJ [Hathewaya histolytica]